VELIADAALDDYNMVVHVREPAAPALQPFAAPKLQFIAMGRRAI
jgi:hypothetical protein